MIKVPPYWGMEDSDNSAVVVSTADFVVEESGGEEIQEERRQIGRRNTKRKKPYSYLLFISHLLFEIRPIRAAFSCFAGPKVMRSHASMKRKTF